MNAVSSGGSACLDGRAVQGETARISDDEERRFAAFVDELKRRGRAAKTVESYRSDWSGLADWFREDSGRPFDAALMAGADVEAFREKLRAEGLRPATVNRKLVFAKRYASWMLRRGELERGAHDEIRAVEPVPQKRRRPKGLSDLELRRFLREVERRAGVRDQAIIYTLLESGLRVSELVALEVEQVCFSAQGVLLTVPDARSGTRREIPLGPLGAGKLRTWLDARDDVPGALFVGERGPLTANAIQRVVRKYCRFAKVKVSPGKLRHTFANSFLARSDGDLVALADLLGHESLETTRLYLTARADEAGPPEPQQPIRPVALAGGGEAG